MRPRPGVMINGACPAESSMTRRDIAKTRPRRRIDGRLYLDRFWRIRVVAALSLALGGLGVTAKGINITVDNSPSRSGFIPAVMGFSQPVPKALSPLDRSVTFDVSKSFGNCNALVVCIGAAQGAIQSFLNAGCSAAGFNASRQKNVTVRLHP